MHVTRTLDKIQGMGDTIVSGPDHACLFTIATEQHGYFTAAQASACRFTWDLLTYHTRKGRFIRVRRGLYRLRDYPSSPREGVTAAWLAAGKEAAIVSHDSALELLGLSDVIPDAVHLTVPRMKRHHPTLPGVIIHTTTRPLQPDDVIVRDGVRLTAATRTILDAAEAGTAPEQIELAIDQAIEQGLTTANKLKDAARERSRRVIQITDDALATMMT